MIDAGEERAEMLCERKRRFQLADEKAHAEKQRDAEAKRADFVSKRLHELEAEMARLRAEPKGCLHNPHCGVCLGFEKQGPM